MLLVGIPVTATAKPPAPAPAYTLGQQVETVSALPTTNGPTTLTVVCPVGKVVTGGGYSADEQLPVRTNAPVPPDRWTVVVVPYAPMTSTPITAYAVCVNPA